MADDEIDSLTKTRRTAADHTLILIKASLNAVPAVGGAIASLVGDYVPTATERNYKKALEFLAEKIKRVEARIDIESVNKDEFAELYKLFRLITTRTHRDEKLGAAAAILSNLLLPPGDPEKVSYEESDHLMRCIDQLSVGALTVLGASRHLIDAQPVHARQPLQFEQILKQFPQFEASFLMSLVSELRGLNLLHVQEPGIRVPSYANYSIELTVVGRRFVEKFLDNVS